MSNEYINNYLSTGISNMQLPPTLYSIMNSIVNFSRDEDDQVSTYELAENSRSTIFDFTYPLTDNITKSDFECQILNHFIMRRIGFETPTMFKIQLQVKLNSIMPLYNKLFDSLNGWNLFADGELSTTSMSNTANTGYSDTPQNQIENIEDSSYVTDYTHAESSGSSSTQRSIGDKMNLYKEFINYKQNIYDMIFKDLECLFYGLY